VDDNKVSHEDPQVVTQILEIMKSYFGKLTFTRGKSQQFLGVDFKIRDDKKIELSAKEHILSAIKMVEDPGESIDATATTPAARHLFDVHEDCPKLMGKYADVFTQLLQRTYIQPKEYICM
jgi:hypothetical protein